MKKDVHTISIDSNSNKQKEVLSPKWLVYWFDTKVIVKYILRSTSQEYQGVLLKKKLKLPTHEISWYSIIF